MTTLPPNTHPTSPTGLQSSVDGNSVSLSWQSASDAETQTAGLTYNLRIGSAPNGVDILSPMSDPVTGFRLVARFGNVFQNHSWTIVNLSPGTYYWSVQAVDNCFAGSVFAPEQTFTITEQGYICGDGDGSGAVDIDDAVYLIQYIFSGGPAPEPIESGDADCSSAIDIDDAVFLIQYIFSGGNSPCDPAGDSIPDC